GRKPQGCASDSPLTMRTKVRFPYSSSFSPLSYLGRAQTARPRVRFTAHSADESPLPIQLIIFPLIIFGSDAEPQGSASDSFFRIFSVRRAERKRPARK